MVADSSRSVWMFTMNGINSILGWNVVLASLDYLQEQFQEYNVYSYLPKPLFIGYFLIGLTYHLINERCKYITLIMIGNTIISLSLISIFVLSIMLQQTALGFYLLLVSSFTIGVGGYISQCSFLAMINFFSQDVVSKFTIGTALSGLFIAGLRAAILAIYGAQNETLQPITIYFIIAFVFNNLNMFLNRSFCSSKQYYQKIDKKASKGRDQSNLTGDQIPYDKKSLTSTEDTKNAPLLHDHNIRFKAKAKQGFFQLFIMTLKVVRPYPIIILFTLINTFVLFPGPALNKQIDGLDQSWFVVIFLIFYNLGDAIGKYIAQFDGAFNKQSLIFMFFSRFFFYFTVTVLANGADKDDMLINNLFFPFVNIFLFGFTNGFCTNGSFIMAFRICPTKFKKQAGVYCGLMLQLGIMLGTFLQIPYTYLIGIN